MADVTWPVGLPQDFLASASRETLPDVVLRTPMDAGPAKVRRRYTTNVRPVQGQLVPMTRAQVEIFKTFFNESLAGGSLAFDWIDPLTEDAVEFRFVCPPPPDLVVIPDSDLIGVECRLEILP